MSSIQQKWSKELIISSLKESAANNYGWPRYTDIKNSNTYPSKWAIKTYFGSWEAACEAAGFVKTEEEILYFSIEEALYYCIENSDYCIPTKHPISWKEVIALIASRKPLYTNSWGLTGQDASRVFKSIFPDKNDNKKYCTWLLDKFKLKHCNKCDKVYYYDNFDGIVKRSVYCKQCNKLDGAYYASKARLVKKLATPAWANLEAIKQIYAECPQGYHVDHIIPMRGKYVCGLHIENNLQYLPAIENCSKNNYHESEKDWI